jgi:hypothetical protein
LKSPRALAFLALLTLATLLPAQAPPTTYTIVGALPGVDQGTMTVYRNGSKAIIQNDHTAQPGGQPASRTITLYDLKAGASFSWDPDATPIACSAGNFSGDWGDPYAMTADLNKSIAKGDLKPAGTETLHGIPTQIYLGASGPTGIKAWLDKKDALVLRAQIGAPSGGPMQTLVDIQKVSLTAPPDSFFALPPTCAGAHPPPTAAELIALETGDSGDNFVNAIYGPGSKDSCSIVLRVVEAKTMAPFTRPWQAAIDTTYNQDSPTPPAYSFGVGNDGTATFSGGGLHEITSQIRNGMLRIDNPPAYFNLSTNFIQPGRGAGIGLIYRQCFAPITMLYYVLKDPNDPGAGGDFLYAKSGKFASVPTH